MLPAQKKVVKLQCRNGLDLAAQTAERRSVNARQHTAVAPLDLALRSRARKAPTQHLPFTFKLRQRTLDLIAIESQQLRQLRCFARPGAFHPSTQHRQPIARKSALLRCRPERQFSTYQHRCTTR